MRIYVPKVTTRNALNAKEWTATLQNGFVTELEAWIASVEPALGECTVFLEIALPAPRHLRIFNTQIDLLVAFADRAAVCEVKAHNWSDVKPAMLQHAVNQVVSQSKLVKRLADRCGYDEDNVQPFLLFPRLDYAQLVDLQPRARGANGDTHLRVAGSLPELHGTCADSGAPLFLPEALSVGFSLARSARPDRRGQDLARRIRSEIERLNNRLEEFTSFPHLLQYVRALPARPVFLPDAAHLPELRAAELQQGLDILARHRTLEICGPPGIGKTSFCRDLIERFIADRLASDQVCYEHREVILRRGRSADIAFALATELFGYTHDALDLQGLVDTLVHEPLIIWISDHDETAIQGLRKLLAMMPQGVSSTPTTRFLIETHRPIGEIRRIELNGLAPTDLTRILRRVSPGGAFADPETVVARAHGNPRLARMLWESTTSPSVPIEGPTGFSWFRNQLTAAERHALDAIVIVMDVAPLGIPISSLVEWCRRVMTGVLPTEVEPACRGLISRLERAQLARVVAVEQSTVAAAISTVPEKLSYPTIVMDIDLGLIAECLGGNVDARKQQRKEAVALYLLECAADDLDLLGVTMALSDGNLDPLFRSSFRHTNTAIVVAWLDRTGFADYLKPTDPQLVLFRALKVIAGIRDHGELSIAKIDALLGPDSGSSPVGRHARQVLRGHHVAVSRNGSVDLDGWRLECNAEPDRNVQAEMEVRLAVAYAANGQHQRAWDLLQELVARPDLAPPVRALVRIHALAQLNRQKVTLAGFDEKRRAETVQRVAGELVVLGLEMGNIATFANALFYAIRDREFWLARVAFDDSVYRELQGYLAGLQFVEATSLSRRLQALLTQGSIHRHCCRWEDLPFEVFQSHVSAAVVLYQRVVDSALPRRQFTFAINAVNYMIDLVKKTLRYAENPSARGDIIEATHTTLLMVERLRAGVAGAHLTHFDRGLLDSIEGNLALLEYLMASASGGHDAVRNQLIERKFSGWIHDQLDALPPSRATLRSLCDDMRFLGRVLTLTHRGATPTALDHAVGREVRRLVAETEQLDHRLGDHKLSSLRRRLLRVCS